MKGKTLILYFMGKHFTHALKLSFFAGPYLKGRDNRNLPPPLKYLGGNLTETFVGFEVLNGSDYDEQLSSWL
jgi:hypothetical protein